jgi:hypothetical protein
MNRIYKDVEDIMFGKSSTAPSPAGEGDGG